MSPAVLRWSAFPLGLLAFGLRVAETFLLRPLTWDQSFGNGLVMYAGGILVAAGVPFGILILLTPAQRPARFVIRGGKFTVPTSGNYAASQVILWMFLSGGFLLTERVPNGYAMRIAEDDTAWPITIIAVGIAWTVSLIFLLTPRPRLDLDPDGLTIRRVWRTTRITWDDLATGGPPPPATRHARQLKLYLNAPPITGYYPPSHDIPVGWLHIDPAFLANAIRRYVEHPGDRSAIGTEEPSHQTPAAANQRCGASSEKTSAEQRTVCRDEVRDGR